MSEKKRLSDAAIVMIRAAIAMHAGCAQACLGESRSILADLAGSAPLPGATPELQRAQVAHDDALGCQRATHDLEAATHSAALTSIGLELVRLEALGFTVEELFRDLARAGSEPEPSGEDDEEDQAGGE